MLQEQLETLSRLFKIVKDDLYLSFVKYSLEDMRTAGIKSPHHAQAHETFDQAFSVLEELLANEVSPCIQNMDRALLMELANKCESAIVVAWKYNEEGIWDISAWRELYVAAQVSCVWTALALHYGQPHRDVAEEHQTMTKLMKAVDMTFIMGGPAEFLQPFAEAVESELRRPRNRSQAEDDGLDDPGCSEAKRLKPSELRSTVEVEVSSLVEVYRTNENDSAPQSQPVQVKRLHLPDIKTFKREYFDCDQPVVITGCCTWEALEKWKDLAWLRETFGHRFIPLEMGLHAESSWHEAVMTMRDFVTKYLEPSAASDKSKEHLSTFTGDRIAYLAQHPLFEQLPSLLKDFSPPKYCEVGELWRTNAWIGTRGTVTPLHFDSYDNLLTQVVGYKRIRLYSQSDTPFLYRSTQPWTSQTKWPTAGHGEEAIAAGSLNAPTTEGSGRKGNVSLVDIDSVDQDSFPLFSKAKTCTETILGPGDILYIPSRYWHHVASLSTSISLNFLF